MNRCNNFSTPNSAAFPRNAGNDRQEGRQEPPSEDAISSILGDQGTRLARNTEASAYPYNSNRLVTGNMETISMNLGREAGSTPTATGQLRVHSSEWFSSRIPPRNALPLSRTNEIYEEAMADGSAPPFRSLLTRILDEALRVSQGLHEELGIGNSSEHSQEDGSCHSTWNMTVPPKKQ